MKIGYCGTTVFEGKTHDVIVSGNQFKLFDGGKFVKFIANSKLRVAGVRNEKDKVIYSKHGYVGCPKQK